jgi:hypothetical protein
MIQLQRKGVQIMKKVLLTILIVIVTLGVLAGVGVAGFRIGYVKGAADSEKTPVMMRFNRIGPDQMPMHRFDNDFGPFDQPNHFLMMRGGFGFGFFPIFRFVWNLAVLGLIVWFFYWRITLDAGTGQVQNSKTDEGN